MKKISILAALALGAALIFSGCDTDAVTEAISELTGSTTEDTTTDETTDDEATTDEAADETAEEEETEETKEYLSIDADDDLGSGYSSSYDAATKTITYEAAYAGRGWWFGEKDASEFTTLNVVFSAATGDDNWLQLTVQYSDKSFDTADGVFTEDGFTLSVELDETKKSNIMQAYIQGKAAGNTATITEAYFQ